MKKTLFILLFPLCIIAMNNRQKELVDALRIANDIRLASMVNEHQLRDMLEEDGVLEEWNDFDVSEYKVELLQALKTSRVKIQHGNERFPLDYYFRFNGPMRDCLKEQIMQRIQFLQESVQSIDRNRAAIYKRNCCLGGLVVIEFLQTFYLWLIAGDNFGFCEYGSLAALSLSAFYANRHLYTPECLRKILQGKIDREKMLRNILLTLDGVVLR